jgi:hypothetical protein
MTARRFPPPWSVEEPDMKLGQKCFRDANRQALSYLYFEEEQGGRAARDLPATPADLGRVFQ